jgi:hypothetical protein
MSIDFLRYSVVDPSILGVTDRCSSSEYGCVCRNPDIRSLHCNLALERRRSEVAV